jgi:CRP-like cAMP-binding protein
MPAVPPPIVAQSRSDLTSTSEVMRRLPLDSRTRLLPQATRVVIRKDLVLCDGTTDLSWTYLPCSGLVSFQTLTEDGNSIEIAMAGREGVIGFALGTGVQRPAYHAVVSIPGETLRVRTDVLLGEFDRSAAVRQVLLTSWQIFLADVAQNAACHRFHCARQRLARWLLSARDRTGLSHFQLTQQDLAERLGVQRPVLTEASLALQEAGAIRSRRGHIVLRDRGRLEQAACECYRVTRPCGASAARP